MSLVSIVFYNEMPRPSMIMIVEYSYSNLYQ